MKCRIDFSGEAIEPTPGIFQMIIYLDVSTIGPPVVSIFCPKCGQHTKRIIEPRLEFDVRHHLDCKLILAQVS